MRRNFVAGNWKMHGSRAQSASLVASVAENLPNSAEVAVIPPFPYLSELISAARGSALGFGAQDLSEHAQGAYTGEVAGSMLHEIGCRYVLVGHSERRQYHAETDAVVARKFVAAQSAGLVPILCIGELLEHREAGQTEKIVGSQLDAVLDLAVGDPSQGDGGEERARASGHGGAEELHGVVDAVGRTLPRCSRDTVSRSRR